MDRNSVYAEPAINNAGSSDTMNLTTNAAGNIEKNTTQVMNQGNYSKIKQLELGANVSIDFSFHNNSETAFLPDTTAINKTTANVTSGNAALADLSSEVTADFNADGFEDKVIGVPSESIGSTELAGAVHVIYGSSGGLSTTAVLADQFITQESLVSGAMISEAGDRFGSSLSSGDFNADGADDLAIGVPYEDYSLGFPPFITNGGLVWVIYGSVGGLLTSSASHNQVWIQGILGLDDVAWSYDFFGDSLSSGDYNGDGKDDLAIGTPFEWSGGKMWFGKVQVIYGSSSGLSTTSVLEDQLWQQGVNGLEDVAESVDLFGKSLSSGDYNGDGKDDLAIGVPDESIEGLGGETISRVGKVHVIYGSSSGLSTTSPRTDQLWQQGVNGLDDVAEATDLLGASLASGDYNGDGKDDLAIAASGESITGETVKYVGKVHVIYGSSSGLSTTSPITDQLWQQGVNGLDDVAEAEDGMGQSLSSGNFNGDKINGRDVDDLAIGVPDESITGETVKYVGMVHVIYGSESGLSTTSPRTDQLWQQGVNGLDDLAEHFDQFGEPLSSGDFNNDGLDDLAIAVPFESVAGETIAAVGKVHVIYGSSSGLSTTSPITDQLWQQGVNGLDDVAEAFEHFGIVL